jgi:serine/threonine protein kinase
MYTPTATYAGVSLGKADLLFEEEKAQALNALDAIHSAGVLHTDIKEDNILVERGSGGGGGGGVADLIVTPGKVRLVDFAFAKVAAQRSRLRTN